MGKETLTIEAIMDFLNSQNSLRHISKVVKTFQRSIPGTTPPVYVPLRPRADSIENDCFENVRRQIAEAGGSIVHGWRIYDCPGLFLEAEFHAVWKAPDGSLLDVSLPPEEGTERIVFFPDPTRTFQGEPVLSRRWPLVRMRELGEYFKATDGHQLALRESARRNGVKFNEPIVRSDPALVASKQRLVDATLALAAALRRSGTV